MTNPKEPGYYSVTIGGRYPSEADSQSLHFLYWNGSTFVYATGEEVDERTVRGWDDPAQQSKVVTEWISIDDQLPETGEEVLIFTNGQEKEHIVGRLTESGKWLMELGWNYGQLDYMKGDETIWEIVNVTHWMPLPNSPDNE